MEEQWRKRGTGISMASIYLRQDTASKGDTVQKSRYGGKS